MPKKTEWNKKLVVVDRTELFHAGESLLESRDCLWSRYQPLQMIRTQEASKKTKCCFGQTKSLQDMKVFKVPFTTFNENKMLLIIAE